MTDWVFMVHDEHGGGVARLPVATLDYHLARGWRVVEVDEDGNVTRRVPKREAADAVVTDGEGGV